MPLAALACLVLAAPLAAQSPAPRTGEPASQPSAATSPRAALGPRLALPLDCEPRKTCFLQNYVDIDPTSGARDYRCGVATYEGHKGVDFRVRSIAEAGAGVAVLASAPGIVKGRRDGVADALVRLTGKAAVAGRECGNGVVIDHGGGWETQVCHLRHGSVVVKSGDRVTRGQKLGLVGYSGMADFAHVHLSVRKDGKVIDPFTGEGPGAACRRDGATVGLWEPGVAQAFDYSATDILDVGFAATEPTLIALEQDARALKTPDSTSGILLFYARITNVAKDDVIALDLTGPSGFRVDGGDKPHPKSQAIAIRYIGKRNTGAPWPAGTYRGEVRVMREGREIARGQTTFELR
jgi:hypothetical protein